MCYNLSLKISMQPWNHHQTYANIYNTFKSFSHPLYPLLLSDKARKIK